MSDASVNVLVLVGGAVGGVGVVGAQAVAARRLLGVHVGPLRTVVAGVLGWAAFGLIGRRLNDSAEWWLFLPLLIGVSMLVTMGVLVTGEALVPSGGRSLLALRRRLSRARRYSEITAIAVRHGLRPYLRGRGAGNASVGRAQLARSLRAALEDGGATFVKLGQMLSTRADLLPAESIEELGRLQEQVAPIPWRDVETVLQSELGTVEETFASLEREPLAAASIAQVHAGRLRSGEEVVVKVQRPGIAPAVERDLDVLLRLAATIEARRRRGLSVHATINSVDRAGLNVVELARGFAAALREELDFRVEARNVAAVAAALEQRGGDPLVRVPVVHEALSSRCVLVLERLHGAPLRLSGTMIDARGLDRHELAVGLLHALLDQIMFDGVFHADPHPGNVLLLDDGRLGLLDFGSVGRLDPIVQGALSRLLVAVERRDAPGLRDALLDLARQPDDVDDRRLVRDLERFVAHHLSPGTRPDTAMFVDLLVAVDAAGLTVPPEAAAVFRTLATLEGTLTQLDPSFDIVAESRRFAGSRLAAGLPRVLGEEISALLPLLGALPRRVDRVAGALEHGRLSLNVRLLADERDRRVITTLVHQGLLAFVAAALGLMSVLLLTARGGALVTSTVTLHQVVGYNLLVVSLLLVLRVLFAVFRPERPR
jgi:ubiquinone biosynthesis protein